MDQKVEFFEQFKSPPTGNSCVVELDPCVERYVIGQWLECGRVYLQGI